MRLVLAALSRPLTVIVALIAIVAGSIMAVGRMPMDIFPQVGNPVIYVAQPYGGMNPAQMEGYLTYYYEYHFLYITGIQSVDSKSIQGAALMKLTFREGTNMDQAMGGVLGEIESMVKIGVSEKELAEAKKSHAKAWEARIAEDDFVLGELNQGLFLGRTLSYWSDLNAKIDKLTVAEVNAAAKQFIDPGKLAKVRAGDLAKKK